MNDSDRRIRVLVADDSPKALLAVCGYLDFEEKFDIVGTACDGRYLVHQARALRPDLVLTDLRMPQMSGLEAAAELHNSLPDVRILIFSQLNGPSLQEECVQHGAHGFVQKSQMPEKLMEEIHRLFPCISQPG